MGKDLKSISVEKFAAFLDGNLSPEESMAIESMISNDKGMQAINEANDVIDMTLASYTSDDMALPIDLSTMSFDIPSIDDTTHSGARKDFSDMDLFSDSSDRFDDDYESIAIELNNHNSQTKELSNMVSEHFNSNYKEGPVIGTPGDEYHQSYVDTCAIKSQQIIINEFGIPCTEDQLVQYSIEHGWYNGQGTAPEDVGKLLEAANIPCKQQVDANVFNLVSELAQGHKVIVGVDSGELWNNNTMGSKFQNWMKDFFQGETSDHALIVAGIDTSDPNNIKVLVTDPGSGEHNKAYPIEQFMDAWADSRCFMVSTEVSVPQIVQGMENFDYQEGHVADVAGVTYSDFQIFNDMSMGIPSYIQLGSGEITCPMSSFVDAYMDYSHGNILFPQIFDENVYDFNNYIDLNSATNALANTYNNGMNQLNLQPNMTWDAYAMENGLEQMTNENYSDYLNQMMVGFNNMNDSHSAMLCDQQMMIVDYCNGNSLNFYDTFYNC